MILPIFLVCFVGVWAIAYIAYLWHISSISQLPGYSQFFPRFPGLPVIPYLNPYPLKTRFNDINTEMIKKDNGKIHKQVFGFGMTRVMVSDAALAKMILVQKSKEFHKPRERYASIFEQFGPNILSLGDDEEWLRQHRLCAPAFSTKNLEYVTKVAYDCTMKMLNSWGNGQKTLRIDEPMSNITLDIISQAGFGFDESMLLKSSKATHTAFKDLIRILLDPMFIAYRFLVPNFIQSLMLWSPFGSNKAKEMTNAYDEFSTYLDEIIEIGRSKTISDDVSTGNGNADLMSLLLTSSDDGGNALTKLQVKSNSFIFLLAGFDTTSCQLMWTMFELARHPDIQTRLYQEVKDLDHSTMRLEDYERLEYTYWVINESMRLHPPVQSVLKYNLHDVVLDGYKIKAGCSIVIDILNIHRSPDNFKDPLEFKPDRWANGALQTAQAAGSFLPFSQGSRKCIGFRFSLTESLVILSTIIQSYHVSLSKDMDPSKEPTTASGIVAKPEKLDITFTKR